jgi:hypothetical protein
MSNTFVNALEIDIWCTCGQEHYAFLDEKDTWVTECPKCGEKVELTFTYRVTEEGKLPEQTNG